MTAATSLLGLAPASTATSVVTDAMRELTDPPITARFVVMLFDSSSLSAGFASGAISAATDVLFGGFTDCTGIEMTQTDTKYSEGGNNAGQLRFPSSLTWTNLTLKRGVTRVSQAGWHWLYHFGQGKVHRMDGVVALLDSMFLPHTMWYFKRAFPVQFTGPALSAMTPAVAIETLVLAHEGLWLVPSTPTATYP
jgi:phage tail-like protein